MARLTKESTVASVHPSLDYVLGLFKNFYRFKDRSVRVGVTGTGQSPHYRFEISQEQPACFDGRTRKELFDGQELIEKNWSEKTMSFSEIQDLVRRMRLSGA